MLHSITHTIFQVFSYYSPKSENSILRNETNKMELQWLLFSSHKLHICNVQKTGTVTHTRSTKQFPLKSKLSAVFKDRSTDHCSDLNLIADDHYSFLAQLDHYSFLSRLYSVFFYGKRLLCPLLELCQGNYSGHCKDMFSDVDQWEHSPQTPRNALE